MWFAPRCGVGLNALLGPPCYSSNAPTTPERKHIRDLYCDSSHYHFLAGAIFRGLNPFREGTYRCRQELPLACCFYGRANELWIQFFLWRGTLGKAIKRSCGRNSTILVNHELYANVRSGTAFHPGRVRRQRLRHRGSHKEGLVLRNIHDFRHRRKHHLHSNRRASLTACNKHHYQSSGGDCSEASCRVLQVSLHGLARA